MANYQLLKADIDAKVYENAQQKITGESLNSVLNAMVTTLGAEYQFAGVATIDTEPETTDAKVFYIANGKGTYTNFGNIEVTEDEVVVLYYDTEWHKVATGIAADAKLKEAVTELTELAGKIATKQDTIADIDAIRQGAQKGSTALQSESDPVYLADKPKLALKVEIPDVSGKVDKVEGKGLSSNDFTDADKLKLAGLENYDDTEVRRLIEGKQDIIPDLESIREGAGKGNEASSTVASIVEAGYVFAGIATPETNPGTPDAKVFYIAATAGTYTYMGGLAVAEGEVAILRYNGTWTKDVTGTATVKQVSQLGEYVKKPTYIRAIVDAEGKFLFGIKEDGSVEWAKGVPTPITEKLEELENKFKENAVNIIEDSNNVEMLVDAEDRIVAYRNNKGEKVENVGIKVKRLSFIADGLSEFMKDLKAEGFSDSSNLSEQSHIVIPLPTSLVKVNITAPQFPTSKVDEIEGYIEFADKNGNYFKKAIKALALQGSTSLGAPKKNLKFDFADCTMKIGNWVMQDSFHLKSNYYDVFRGKSNLAYDLWRKIIEYNRPNAFRTPYLNASEYSWYDGVNDMGNDFNEARLVPAGFPIELYFNDEYIGIYTWNIKKDRVNYAMDKKKSNNIHIDPFSINSFLKGESIIWENFEIRNPKSLVTMNGAKYDGDAPLELIDSSSPAYDSSNSDHKRSAEVKASIIAFKDACADVIAKKDKATFERYFDKDWFIDFNIWGNVILDGDSLERNTQYLYWGSKWYPAPYDCDQIYGNNWRGNYICRKDWMRVVNESILGRYEGIYDIFLTLYAADIEQRYKELRDADVISPNSVISQISQYVNLIGKDAYEREFARWPETPSYREPNDNPQWHYEGDYYEGTPSEWNDSSSYKAGDYVSMSIEGKTYYWKCLQDNVGVIPYYDKYGKNPLVGGCFDSLTRTEKWLNVRFEFLDNHFNR